jgi:hypothetical protein
MAKRSDLSLGFLGESKVGYQVRNTASIDGLFGSGLREPGRIGEEASESGSEKRKGFPEGLYKEGQRLKIHVRFQHRV